MRDDPTAPRSFSQGTVSRDAAWALAYSGVIRFATLCVSVAVARQAGTAGIGAFGVALQVTALVSVLASFNLPMSLTKHLAESDDPRRRRTLIRTSGALILVLGLIVGAGLALSSRALAGAVYRDPELGRVLIWCAPLVLVTAGCAWVEGWLQGVRRFETLTRWGLLIAVLDLVFGVLASLSGVVGVLVSRTAIRLVAVFAALAHWLRPEMTAGCGTREGVARPTAEFVQAAGPLLSFAGPALVSGAILLAGQTMLRLLLVRGSGLAAAGHYQAADSLAQGLTLIPAAAAIAFMRAVSSGRESGYAALPASLRRGFEQILGYNLGLCLAIIGTAPWLTSIIFGPGFEDVQPVLVLLAVAYGLLSACAVFGATILGRGEVWTGVAVNLMWAVVMLVVYVFVTSRLGATGAALAVVGAYLVLLATCVILLAPRWGIRIRSLAPASLVTVTSLGMGCALALTPGVPPLMATIGCLALGMGIFIRWGWPTGKSAGRWWRAPV